MLNLKRKLLVVASLLIALFSLAACYSTTEQTSPDQATINSKEHGKLKVMTSFFIPYDLAKQIGGENIELISLVSGGVEPHDWEPGPQDIKNILNTDIFIYSGAGMEPWIESVKEANKNADVTFLDLSQDIDLIKNNDAEVDPHIWLNPLNVLKQLEKISKLFSEKDPSHQSDYQSRYTLARQRILDLHHAYQEATRTFSSKILLVSHEAFAYLCQEYGLEQAGIRGITPEDEPSPRRIAELINFAKEKQARVVFFEELVSPKIAEIIASEAGLQTATLNPLEGGNFEHDYVELMTENLQQLIKFLK